MGFDTANRIGRRGFFALGMGAALAGATLSPRRLMAGIPRRVLSLRNAHNNETVTAEYFCDGWYNPDVLARFDSLLRDRRTGESITMDSGLLDILYHLQEQVGGNRELSIVCGYRSPRTNAMLAATSRGVARNSFHMYGRAADLTLPGYSLPRLRDIAMDLRAGGVGYYPRSNFIHVDTGSIRHW